MKKIFILLIIIFWAPILYSNNTKNKFRPQKNVLPVMVDENCYMKINPEIKKQLDRIEAKLNVILKSTYYNQYGINTRMRLDRSLYPFWLREYSKILRGKL